MGCHIYGWSTCQCSTYLGYTRKITHQTDIFQITILVDLQGIVHWSMYESNSYWYLVQWLTEKSRITKNCHHLRLRCKYCASSKWWQHDDAPRECDCLPATAPKHDHFASNLSSATIVIGQRRTPRACRQPTNTAQKTGTNPWWTTLGCQRWHAH
jgi:hypothetical protein